MSRTRASAGHRRTHLAALACAAIVPVVAAGCGGEDGSAAAAFGSAAPVTTTAAATTSSSSPIAAFPTLDPYAGLPLIDHVEWTETVDGPRLLVFPTTAGRRTASPGADERAWQEVVEQSAEAETPGMRDQFVCHWEWARLAAPNKPSWNLEPWRPDVGYQATVQASCNPGGPER